MRNEPTATEKKLWLHLRAGKLGTKARRQMTIGTYIADFGLPEHKIIIEVDGPTHAKPEQIELDARRTAWFEEQGFKIVRFGNHAVLQNTEGVIQRILENIADTPPNPPPLKRGGIRRNPRGEP